MAGDIGIEGIENYKTSDELRETIRTFVEDLSSSSIEKLSTIAGNLGIEVPRDDLLNDIRYMIDNLIGSKVYAMQASKGFPS